MSRMHTATESGLGSQRGIRILQHNMQRSRIVPHEIRAQMNADGNAILLMQEPYSIEDKVPRLGTEIAIACRGSKQEPPMAAVGIRCRHMTALEIAGLCTTHCVCVQISDGATEIYIVSQYFPPIENIEIGIRQLEDVLRHLKGRKAIIGVDANAKSPLWNSGSTDDRSPGGRHRTIRPPHREQTRASAHLRNHVRVTDQISV
jgi:hypothetical protein